MAKLSQRLGLTSVRNALQGRSLDTPTRTRLWSAFVSTVPRSSGVDFNRTWMKGLYEAIWADYLKEPLDLMPWDDHALHNRLRRECIEKDWFDTLDFIEFVAQSNKHSNGERFRELVGQILREEEAGFRWLDGQFVEITDETELHAIEEALATTNSDRFNPARVHLKAALDKLSDRQTPDFRNSIKEAISAVEAVTQILSSDPQAELGNALAILEKRRPLHGALRRALLALYGYTSDADGIRHALSDESDLDGADAKFMLVSCAAFVVYLIQRA